MSINNLTDETRSFGDFTLDVRRACLMRAGKEVKLRPKPFEALKYLVKNPGRVVTKAELLQAVWPDSFVTDDSLVQCLRDVRRALGDDQQLYIKTVPRRGYIFDAEITEPGLATPIEVCVETVVESATIPGGKNELADGGIAAQSAGALNSPKGSNVSIWYRWKSDRKAQLIALLSVGLMAAFFYFWISGRIRPSAAEPKIRSIAVLPFKSLSADASDDYMGLGMTDTLITRLSNIHEIVVRPTSAVRKYVAADQDPYVAGREQMVEAVLEGSMQLSGKKLRVTVRLVNVRDHTTMWGYQCDEYCTDIFAAQDAISQNVAEALKIKLSGEEKIHIGKRYTDNLEAYQQYLKGRYFWEKRTFESLQKGGEFFEKAIQLDPNYALAYTGLADCYVALWGRGYYPFGLAAEKIRAAASRALEIDDTLGEAHTDLACYYTIEYNFREAEQEHHRAIALSPNYPLAHLWYGYLLEALGRREESYAERKRGQELDPLSPVANTGVGAELFRLGQYEKAREQFLSTLEMNPDFVMAHEYLGYYYLQKGKYPESVAEYQKTQDKGALGFAYAMAGKKAEAKKTLADLIEQSKRQYVSAVHMARIYTGLGEKDQVFAWLEKAYIEHAPMLLFLKEDHAFYASLQSDPRFKDLLWRIGLDSAAVDAKGSK